MEVKNETANPHESSTLAFSVRDMIFWLWNQETLFLGVYIFVIFQVAICVLPWLTLVQLYLIALFLKAWRYCFRPSHSRPLPPDFWNLPVACLARLYTTQGRILHGYEVVGFEKIPLESSAILVLYHGAVTVDLYYLLAEMFFRKRKTSILADQTLFDLPATDAFIEAVEVVPGDIDTCVDTLRKGKLLVISPGGVREALFADEKYPLVWAKRTGFARVAQNAKVPVIPVFTRNIREAYYTSNFWRTRLRDTYERTRRPVVPLYGGFPVKLTTYIGEPIPYDPTLTVQELADKVANSMKDLIKLHQPTPGSIIRGLKERIQYLLKMKSS